MIGAALHPTPYADVNAALGYFLSGTQQILGNRFLALYLSGSLALGDFDPVRSDIDFVVVTIGEVPDALLPALQSLHARFNAGDSPWATEVEAAYLPQDALRRYDPRHACHPHIQRGARETLVWDQLASDWVLQRFILREHGVVVAGPSPRILIDPITPPEMRRAIVALMAEWWGTMPVDPAPLRRPGYQAYAVLTMCRMLYTLEHGTVVSKPVAARWAQQALGDSWTPLIDRALAWRKDRQETMPESVDGIVALIEYTRMCCEEQDRMLRPSS
jgi:predicted nucleotidyltransferase